jgi:hypothetical protein
MQHMYRSRGHRRGSVGEEETNPHQAINVIPLNSRSLPLHRNFSPSLPSRTTKNSQIRTSPALTRFGLASGPRSQSPLLTAGPLQLSPHPSILPVFLLLLPLLSSSSSSSSSTHSLLPFSPSASLLLFALLLFYSPLWRIRSSDSASASASASVIRLTCLVWIPSKFTL